MAEELSAETRAEVRAFDEAGHVRNDVGFLIGLLADSDYAEVGFEGGEGVVGDFGFGSGNAGDERGLTGIGVSDQANVGEELELETEQALFSGASELVFTRGLMGRSCEVLVAATASAAFGNDNTIVRRLEVMDQLTGFLIVERGADGDLKDDGFAIEAGAIGSHAVLAALRLVFGVVAEVNERVVLLGADHDDIAAPAAVAARGAAAGDELLTAEGHAAVAAVASFDPNFCFIDEHGRDSEEVKT